MKIHFVNNDGAGFADHVEVAEGTTLSELVAEKTEGSPSQYNIRVNGSPAARSYVLQAGDRVSVTPQNIKGA